MIAPCRPCEIVLFPRDVFSLILVHHDDVLLFLWLSLLLGYSLHDGHLLLNLLSHRLLLFNDVGLCLVLGSNSNTHFLKSTASSPSRRRSTNLCESAANAGLLVRVLETDTAHIWSLPWLTALAVVAGRELLHISQSLPVVVVIGAQVIFIVELARIAFVADGAVEEADGVGDRVVSLQARC